MRRGRIRIRNKMGFQIVTILIFTIILPSIFFFWFIVQRYSNDLLSAAISERENLLEAINKSISLHFDNVQELSMTIYYDTSTKNYIDGHAYEEPSAAVEEALVTILNSRQSAESMALCFGGETYVYGKSFTNLQRYREQYEQQVLEREGKCVWLPTNVMQGSFARKPKDYALARAINAPDGQVGVFYMFLSSDHLWKILTNPLLTEGSSHYYLLAPDGRIVMSDLDALTGTDMQLDFTLAQLDGQSGHLLITGEGGRRRVATYARMESTGWVSVILADRDELYSNAISLMRLARSFTVFYLMVLFAGNLAIYAFITSFLTQKDHAAVGVVLGNGWYNCFTKDEWNTPQASWRAAPKLLCEIHIEYLDGSTECIGSDEAWSVSRDGPIVFNAIRSGEWYDARKEDPKWVSGEANHWTWTPAIRVRSPGGALRAAEDDPIRITKEITPVSARITAEGRMIADMGQNFAGKVRLRVAGNTGTHFILRYAEELTKDGEHVDQTHLRCFVKEGEFQTEHYIKGTDSIETWTSHFTYHGFRYVELTCVNGSVADSSMTGLVMHTDFRQIGRFDCSDDGFNTI